MALVFVAGCHGGDAPTEPRLVEPTRTPTPVAAVQLAGTWTASLGGQIDGRETFSLNVTQNGLVVRAAWTSAAYGAMKFNGRLEDTRLTGTLSAEHMSSFGCWLGQASLTGDASPDAVSLTGTALCRFDPARVSLSLTR